MNQVSFLGLQDISGAREDFCVGEVQMRAAVTIVSKNYFSCARVLAESFRRHNPNWQFFVVLMDDAENYLETGVVGETGTEYEVVEASSLELPDFGTMVYRYSIMELNTAIKPFVLNYLMSNRGFEEVSYIDPDILFFAPMTKVEEALTQGDLCLIPHMRKPFYDDKSPSDLSILQSGTYNLGFVAMRSSPDVQRLLDWWMGKLYLDCIVDIPNGLFVDQKWMDLAPGFVPNTVILADPGYNVAYWNLHERRVARNGTSMNWTVDGEPLVFFHFSGYTPHMPGRLSKHQNRHDLAFLPEVRALCDIYGAHLLSQGYDTTCNWPYAYASLPNGIALPMNLVRNIVLDLLRKGVSIPDPLERPEEFCELLLQPGKTPHYPKVSAFQHHLLERRPDVKSAFPDSVHDPADEGFWNWVSTSGAAEEGTGDFAKLAATQSAFQGLAEIAFRTIWDNGRLDVIDAFADMWFDRDQLEGFAVWAGQQAQLEGFPLRPETGDAILEAGTGPAAVLNIFFARGDLQQAFRNVEDPAQADRFAGWLRANRQELDLTCDQITMFREFVRLHPEKVQWMRYLYQHGNQKDASFPLARDCAERAAQIGAKLKISDVVKNIMASENPLASHFTDEPGRSEKRTAEHVDHDPALMSLKPNTFYSLRTRIINESEHAPNGNWVNFAGSLSSRTGMGESARSTLALLQMQDRPVAVRSLPVKDADQMVRKDGQQFGVFMREATCSVTIANADSIDQVRRVLPRDYWGERRIGYWVWETEELPAQFANAAEWYDEIWTPSEYSAQAIRSTVRETPVHVLPHIVDIATVNSASGDRRRWELPEDKTLFGFMFDPKSVLERKNVTGLIDCFLDAVRPDDNAVLVLKSNDRGSGNLEYDRIKARARAHPQRIIFKETFLSRLDTLAFMKSFDSYVSLHRSEGFGLTCAEAMACGVPVIASGYSGNLDFMTKENSRLVKTRRVISERAHGPYQAGSRWGVPEKEDASAAIRELLDADRRAALGVAGRKSVASKLSAKKIAVRMAELLEAAA